MIPELSNCVELEGPAAAALGQVPAFAGVYLLTDDADRPILLAHAENIRRAVLHRLTARADDAPSRRADLSGVARRLYWAETFSAFETAWVHYLAARAMYPKAYREMTGMSLAWHLRVDTAAAHPRFTSCNRLRRDGATYVGPLATSRDAEEWIRMLEDAFDLCRYHEVLEKSPLGVRCAYYDMGKCPAPCDGTISMQAYQATVGEALAFTLGDRRGRLDALRRAMQDAAANLSFEKAGAIRKTIERAESLMARLEYAFLCNVGDARWMTIQGAGRKRRTAGKLMVRPYYVDRFGIRAGDASPLGDLDAVLPAWVAAARNGGDREAIPDAMWTDVVSIVSRFLFQGEKAPGVFLRADEIPDVAGLKSMIHARFVTADASAMQSATPEPEELLGNGN